MKITRRTLALSAALPWAARGQTPAPAAPAANDDELLRAAREQARRSGEALARFQIPITTEPAFQFKP